MLICFVVFTLMFLANIGLYIYHNQKNKSGEFQKRNVLDRFSKLMIFFLFIEPLLLLIAILVSQEGFLTNLYSNGSYIVAGTDNPIAQTLLYYVLLFFLTFLATLLFIGIYHFFFSGGGKQVNLIIKKLPISRKIMLVVLFLVTVAFIIYFILYYGDILEMNKEVLSWDFFLCSHKNLV